MQGEGNVTICLFIFVTIYSLIMLDTLLPLYKKVSPDFE